MVHFADNIAGAALLVLSAGMVSATGGGIGSFGEIAFSKVSTNSRSIILKVCSAASKMMQVLSASFAIMVAGVLFDHELMLRGGFALGCAMSLTPFAEIVFPASKFIWKRCEQNFYCSLLRKGWQILNLSTNGLAKMINLAAVSILIGAASAPVVSIICGTGFGYLCCVAFECSLNDIQKS